MEKQLNLLTDDECTCSQCKTPVKVKTEDDLNKKPKATSKKLVDVYRNWRP